MSLYAHFVIWACRLQRHVFLKIEAEGKITSKVKTVYLKHIRICGNNILRNSGVSQHGKKASNFWWKADEYKLWSVLRSCLQINLGTLFHLTTYWSCNLFQRKDPSLYIAVFKQPQSYVYVIDIYIHMLHIKRVTLGKGMYQNLNQLRSKSRTKIKIKVPSASTWEFQLTQLKVPPWELWRGVLSPVLSQWSPTLSRAFGSRHAPFPRSQ